MRVFREEGFISRIYYESMRDNFEGYGWDLHASDQTLVEMHQRKTDQLERLKAEFKELDPLTGGDPTLGQLFQIELALIWLVPESALRARFWTIEDRFRRVVPDSVVSSYENSFERGAIDTVAEETLRQRARNLLDVIHANYLINLAREKTIKRIMIILTIAATLIIGVASVVLTTNITVAHHGLAVIIVAGMFGAMISIIQRLQKATSRDAMVEDGIFELIGLRVGWLSVLLSIGIGGVFALFLYVLVMADAADLLLPDIAGGDDPERDRLAPASGGADAPANTASAEAAPPLTTSADPSPLTLAANGDGAPADATGAPPAAGADAPAAGNTEQAQGSSDERKEAAAKSQPCPISNKTCIMWVDKVADSLGLQNRVGFYKMIATAFVAGFAERFVPDIINKIGKQGPGPSNVRQGGGNPGG